MIDPSSSISTPSMTRKTPTGTRPSTAQSGYSAPSYPTSSLVPDGQLLDFDTAEVTALPVALNKSAAVSSSGSGTGNGIAAAAAAAASSSSTSSTSSGLRDMLSPSSLSATSINGGHLISRPNSASGLIRVKVDKSSQEEQARRSMYSHPPLEDADLIPTEQLFAHRGGAPPYGNFNIFRRVRFGISQLIANALSSGFLILIVIWALSVRCLAQLPKLFFSTQSTSPMWEWDDIRRWAKEGLVKDVRYYAKSCGFEIRNETVETADGYYLRIHRVIDPQQEHLITNDGKGGFPVLILHGLFQSSGSFVTSEDRSLAFWLARHGGYQVFLGNNRGVFDMGHKRLSRSDPRFWDYNIRELAIYDIPAMVDYVRKETGYDKIAYIGHSQGNGSAFISLSKDMVPELGDKLSYFAALAPAVFAGPLTSCFPFTSLGHMEWKTWKRIFGVLDFIPLMKFSYDWTPAWPYALLGYQMFAFLFAWTDANWLLRRKAKMFRFTPQPVSSTSIYWWAGKDGFASRGCILDPNAPRWWDSRFPPLSIFSGGMDFLVLTDPLIERLEKIEIDVRVLRFKRQDQAEHCDHFWAAEAVEWCFHDLLEDIETTRSLYPVEVADGNRRRVKKAPSLRPGNGNEQGDGGQQRQQEGDEMTLRDYDATSTTKDSHVDLMD